MQSRVTVGRCSAATRSKCEASHLNETRRLATNDEKASACLFITRKQNLALRQGIMVERQHVSGSYRVESRLDGVSNLGSAAAP